MERQNRTLFLDRDGIVNVRLVGDYVKEPNQLILKNDFLEVMEQMAPHFQKIFIITNQQGIGKGLMTLQDLERVHAEMLRQLSSRHIPVTKIYVCPHLASDGCNCRKPAVGLAQQAKADFPDIDFSQSVMVGDALSDLQFGRACGMKTVFVNDAQVELTPELCQAADVVVDRLTVEALS